MSVQRYIILTFLAIRQNWLLTAVWVGKVFYFMVQQIFQILFCPSYIFFAINFASKSYMIQRVCTNRTQWVFIQF